MKKRLMTALLFLLLVCAAGGVWAFWKYAPSGEQADPEAWFGVSGDEVAVFLNNERSETDGRLIRGQVYLPMDWVTEQLNERFYWASEEHQLVYTLPESIVYADATTLGSGGTPLFVEDEDQVWLLTGLIRTYTDVRVEEYTEDSVRRVFLDTSREPVQTSVLRHGGRVRVKGGVKSSYLTEAKKGETVTVLEQMEHWSRVRTESGYIGYLPNLLLSDLQEVTPVSTFQEPVYTSISLGEPVSLVWHQVTSKDANGAMEKLIAKTKGVNVIAPTWFMLTDNEGNYESLADRTYVDRAHALGLQVWGVLDNFNQGDAVRSEVLFASSAARKKLIDALMADAAAYGLDGINLDVEGIKPAAGKHYVQFIRELSVSCRKNGVILSVDTYVPTAYSQFYNRAEQGRVADYVVIMAYDEHYAGGDAGSVSSLGYVKKGIEDTLESVPAEKLVCGIPLYTRLWKTEGAETTSAALSLSSAARWVQENGVELTWQEDLGQYYGEKTVDGVACAVWMEDERSLEEKMTVIRQSGIAGAAFWKLGFDTEDIWDVLQP